MLYFACIRSTLIPQRSFSTSLKSKNCRKERGKASTRYEAERSSTYTTTAFRTRVSPQIERNERTRRDRSDALGDGSETSQAEGLAFFLEHSA